MNTHAKAVPASYSMQNLLETAAARRNYSTFGKAVEAAGLSETLAGPGPFTIFAPTDAAFANLPEGKLDMLLRPGNKAELVALVNHHVIAGRNTAAAIGKWTEARTMNGTSAAIKLVGRQLSIDDAQVTSPDMDARNGYLHGIDKVNLPAGAPAAK